MELSGPSSQRQLGSGRLQGGPEFSGASGGEFKERGVYSRAIWPIKGYFKAICQIHKVFCKAPPLVAPLLQWS